MKELSDLKIIAVDHGYGNIKTVNTVTPTGITAYDTPPAFSGNVLEYRGVYYRVGEGHKEFIQDKAMDDDFYILTLMAVAKELRMGGIREANVYLAAGLPMKWIRNQREAFYNYLMRAQDVDFRFDGVSYHVHFKGCDLYPQGYPAVLDLLKDFDGSNLLADIGNGTMNLLYIEDKRPVESRCWTEKFGVNQCVIAARNAVLENLGTKIDDFTIERVLRFGCAKIEPAYQDCIRAAAEKYVSEIFATLRQYEYEPAVTHLYVVGGGSCLIRNFYQYDENRVTILDDVCATAKGYEYLTYVNFWGEE